MWINGETKYLINFHTAAAIMSEWSKEPVLRSGSVSCVGSNPTDCNFFARLAQLVERQTLNLVVAGSSPAVGTKLMGRV